MSLTKLQSMKDNLEIRLETGDTLRIYESLISCLDITYAGMPSDQAYSLLVDKSFLFFNLVNGNFYFPSKNDKAKLEDYQFEVLEVQPNYIKLANFEKK